MGKSKPHSSNFSVSHSLANISQSHSPKPTLSFTMNSSFCSSVKPSALTINTSFMPASLHAFKRILPPSTILFSSTTIGRSSSISGNSCIDLTSFLNLSSLIKRGFFGFVLTSDIFTLVVCIYFVFL